MAKIFTALFILSLGLVLTSAQSSRDKNNKSYRLVCYLGSWAYYRHGEGKFNIEDNHLDVNLCTHLMYGFTKLENDRITPFDPYLDLKEDWGRAYYEKFNALRRQNPGLTTIVAIGGWNEGSQKYSDMARDANRRRVFVNSVVEFLQRYDFDGLDFDWEYPANREGSRAEDKQNFIAVIRELKAAFAPYGYVLTAAVSAGKPTIDSAYDIKEVDKYLDFVNVMTYDFHGAWDSVTGHNSPLFARQNELPGEEHLNLNFSVNYWLNQGLRSEKLVVGMPLYGRCFTLANPSINDLGSPVVGPGRGGPFTNEPGMIGYNEICKWMKDSPHSWKVTWDDNIKAPYAVHGNQWCGFDNERSLALKVDYLRSLNLGGAMVWSLETDDFRGLCRGVRNPLLTTIKEKLQGHTVVIPTDTPTVHPPTDRPTAQPSTPKPTDPAIVGDEWCQSEGTFGFPGECVRYYQCIMNGGKFSLIPRSCPQGTAFDNGLKRCQHSNLVDNCGKPDVTTRAPNTTPPTAAPPTAAPTTTARPTVQPTTTARPTVQPTTTAPPTVVPTSNPDGTSCTSIGKFPHQTDCTKYFTCQKTTRGFKQDFFTCPFSLVYNPRNKVCDYVTNVPECQTVGRKVGELIACGAEGYHPYPGDCTKFISCIRAHLDRNNWFVFQCPSGLYYNSKIHSCDWIKPNVC